MVLIVISVSVVWTVAHATYILNEDGGFEILHSIRLDEHHRPIFHSNFPIHFNHHSHGIFIPHLAAQRIQYINEPIHHLHHIQEYNFNIPSVHHQNAKHYHHYPKSEEKPQTHQTNEQKFEIKSHNDGFSIPHHNNQPQYQNTQKDRHFPDLVFKHGFNFGNDYNHNTDAVHSHQEKNHNVAQGKTNHANTYDTNQQKLVDIDFSKKAEQKVEQKAHSDDYEQKEEHSHPPDYNGEQDKNSHTSYKATDQNPKNNDNNSQHDFKHNEHIHPEIYSHIHLIPAHYTKLHENNVNSYSQFPRHFGEINPVYRDTDILKYQSGLNSHQAIKIHSHTPILTHNIQANLGNQGEYYVLKNQDFFPNLDGYEPYYFLSNNGSQSDLNNFPKYPNQETYNSDSNLEQKPVSEEYKSDQEKTNVYNTGDDSSEYKESGDVNVPENESHSRHDISYHPEQKNLEVGYKDQSKENEKKYDEQKTLEEPKYTKTSPKSYPEYSLEQKTVEIKSSPPNVDYVNDGKDGKISAPDTQQKYEDVDFKSGSNKYDYKQEGNIASDYGKFGNSGDSKYPEVHSKKPDKKIEQKPVETEVYKGIKAFFKPLDGEKNLASSSHKDYSEDIRSSISDLKKDIDSKISNYEPPIYVPRANHGHPKGGSSSTYFNSHQPQNTKNSFSDTKKSNYLSYPNSANQNKHTFTGSTHRFHGMDFPKYPNYFDSSLNHNRPVTSYTNSHARASNFNYNKPHTLYQSSTTGSHRYPQPKSTYSGITKSPFHSGFSGPASVSSIPTYHQGSSRGISTPLQYKNSDPQNDRKLVKISYKYPHHSLNKDEPIYASSRKPGSDYKNTFANSNSYHPFKYLQSSNYESPLLKSGSHSSANSNKYNPHKNENDLKKIYQDTDKDVQEQSKDDTDFSEGIGGIEYAGIGEKKSTVAPKYKIEQHSEPHEQSMDEQKQYKNDETLPTYTESIHMDKSSENEYKGIGEIGTIPSGKSDIVGGRHPIRRPAKSSSTKTKSVPIRAKGKSGDKTEQKYLPITATLSEKKPNSKQYNDPIKKEAPGKIEQQEELAYEALLGGHGTPNQATATSGYGFNAPAPTEGSPYPHGSAEDDHEVRLHSI